MKVTILLVTLFLLGAAAAPSSSSSSSSSPTSSPTTPLNQEENSARFEAASTKGEAATDTLLKLLDNGGDGVAAKAALANTRTDQGGESLLHLACIWGGARKMRGLLAAGADPNARSSKQETGLDMTPLTWCCYAGYTDAVKEFLRDARTDVNLVVRTEDGGYMTALDIAHKIGEMGEPLVALLKEHDAHTFADLKAMSFGGEEIPGMPPVRKEKKK
jgi:hypothetical protein